MKHHILPALVLLLAAPVVNAQQAALPPPMISTNGSAEIHVKPDLADLSFDIEIRNIDLAAARKQQAAITAKLLAALRAADIKEQDLQASQVTISPVWNERRGVETATVKFYIVSQSVSCTLHDVDKVPDVTTAAIATGVTGVSPAVFRTVDLRKYRDEARAQAIRAAKEKAEALTKELGVKVGAPRSIQETEAYAYAGRMNASNSIQNVSVVEAGGGGGDAAQPAFAPGMITVSASISVSFVLEE